MPRIVLGVFVLCLLSSPAGALNWRELAAEIDSVESGNAGNAVMMQRVSALITMLMVYRDALVEAKSVPLFCPPPGGSMGLDEVVSIVRAEARRQDAADSSLVQQLLLSGMRRRFPCE